MSEQARPQPDALREALLDQLGYLIDEVEALRAVIHRVPEPLLQGRPREQDRSIKETYGLLAAADAQVYLPQFQQMAAGGEAHFEAVDEAVLVAREPWNTYDIDDILQRTQAARRHLLDFLRTLPAEAWAHTAVFGQERLSLPARIHQIIQRDTDLLRTLGYRLHESHLSARPRDLPK